MWSELGFLDVAKTTRRLSGPSGGPACQDALGAADAYSPPETGKDEEAWVVYRMTKKQSEMKRKREEGSRMGEDKVEGGLTATE